MGWAVVICGDLAAIDEVVCLGKFIDCKLNCK